MRGLLEKDLRLTLTKKQTLLIFIIVSIFMAASTNGSFVVSYMALLATILSIGTLSYDEFDNGYSFLMTLPFERKTYVMGKYLLCLIYSSAAWCLGLIVYCISSVWQQHSMPELPQITASLIAIPSILLVPSLLIPLQFKFGSEKSRLALAIIFGGIAVFAFAMQKNIEILYGPVSKIISTVKALPAAAAYLGFTLICIILVFISYLCSVRIIENKEF